MCDGCCNKECNDCDSKVTVSDTTNVTITVGGCQHPSRKEVKAHQCRSCGTIIIESNIDFWV